MEPAKGWLQSLFLGDLGQNLQLHDLQNDVAEIRRELERSAWDERQTRELAERVLELHLRLGVLVHLLIAKGWFGPRSTPNSSPRLGRSHRGTPPNLFGRKEGSMPGKTPLILVAAAALVGIASGVAGPEKGDKTDTLVKEAVEQFFKTFKAKDIDGLMKAVDVPFCREGGKNIDKRDDLKQFLQKALEVRDSSKDTLAIKLVTTLPKFEESEGKFTDNERKGGRRGSGQGPSRGEGRMEPV